MIRNVVFDMGNVLLEYRPITACLRHAGNPSDAQAILEALFMAPEWEHKLDGCFITEAEMLEIAHHRLPTQELRELCTRVFEDFHEDALTPMAGMDKIIEELHERGFRLFLLSNVGERFYSYKHKLPRGDLFDGMLLSGEEKLLKPDPAIYHRILEKFSLQAQECLFVDDWQVNVDAAISTGMAGYVFLGSEREALSAYLDGLEDPKSARVSGKRVL